MAQNNRSRIARFILKQGSASKPEIASALKLSMPTVLQCVKDLMDAGILEEAGECESTGGRKAKALSVVPDIRYGAGIDITANHVSFVLIDLVGNVLHHRRNRLAYEHSPAYYRSVRDHLDSFLREIRADQSKLLGTGISLPGIIDRSANLLVRSHILNVENISLQVLSQYFDQEPFYENDASAAAMAELRHDSRNAVYLSLSNTVGGAIYFGQALYPGDHFRSAEFGHMVLVPGGLACYCGKKGCVDAYCSAKVLARGGGGSLEGFFEKLEARDPEAMAVWDQYMDRLAVTVSNLRMSFDCDIILGGYVGGFLKPYLGELGQRVLEYNRFDRDSSYIQVCRYAREASAVGAALTFAEQYLDTV